MFYWMSFPIPEGNLALAKHGPSQLGLARYLFAVVKGYLGKWLLYRMVLPRAHHVFVQSEHMLDAIAARGVSRHKLTAVPMGVDLETANVRDVVPSDDPRLRGRRVLVYLGVLDRERRIDVLFEMLRIVRRVIPNVLLVLVGDTADAHQRQWLLERMRAEGVEDLVLQAGWLPMAAAWRYVRAAEVGLSPVPRGELFDVASPTKAAEYMAFGIPVLANDQPDQARILTESGAGVCVPLSAEAFADATLSILANGEYWARRGAAGRSYIQSNRSYAVISARLAHVYERLLKFDAQPERESRKGGQSVT
jgi:glycosyltransferase involved in cell wall biosynthesis